MVMIRALCGLVLATIVTGQEVMIEPKEAVQRIGSELNVLCKVGYSIESCRMTVGNTPYLLKPENQDGDVTYYGAGKEKGECGAHLKNIKEDWNGNITCILPPANGNIELTNTMRLIVARAPAEPILIAPENNYFKENDVFEAQCEVANGRPAAVIHWFLDDMELDSRVIHAPVTRPGSSPDLVTISQNISLRLLAEHDARTVVCSAEHVGRDVPMRASRQLNVEYPPKRTEPDASTITIFGLRLNEPGLLNVTVRSNPPPHASWSVGATRLTDGETSHDGAMHAQPPMLVSPGGFYNITLTLPQLTKEDVDREYKLNVSNRLGYELFTLRISTMDEPAGVELSTGAIVGIVIAVLVLIAAVSLAVFAKATDRWCFSGRGSADLPDAADSEAPLPPSDHSRGAENPTHEHHYITNGNGKHPEKKPDTAV